MELAQILNESKPYLHSAGFGAFAGGLTYLAVSGLRALGPGSTLLEEFKDNRNVIVGAAAGLASAVGSYECVQGMPWLNPDALIYVGAAAFGGVGGLVMNPVVGALVSKDSVSGNASRRIRNGFIAGAIALPAAYALAEVASRYL